MNTRNRITYERPNQYPYERTMYRSVSAHNEPAKTLTMKVICIDDKHWHSDTKCPAFGEITTVEKSFTSPVDGRPVYSFTEYPPEPPRMFRCFSQKYFAPLSDLDETTLVNEEWEEKVCVPVNEMSCV